MTTMTTPNSITRRIALAAPMIPEKPVDAPAAPPGKAENASPANPSTLASRCGRLASTIAATCLVAIVALPLLFVLVLLGMELLDLGYQATDFPSPDGQLTLTVKARRTLFQLECNKVELLLRRDGMSAPLARTKFTTRDIFIEGHIPEGRKSLVDWNIVEVVWNDDHEAVFIILTEADRVYILRPNGQVQEIAYDEFATTYPQAAAARRKPDDASSSLPRPMGE